MPLRLKEAVAGAILAAGVTSCSHEMTPNAAATGPVIQHRYVGPDAAQVALAERARAVLEDALVREEGWIRIHAAEALVLVGAGEQIRRQFEKELPTLEASAFRVGAWRVLATTSRTPEERARWAARIEQVFLNPANPDRLQAIESIGKLGVRLTGTSVVAARVMAESVPANAALFPIWALYLAGDNEALLSLAGGLDSEDIDVRRRAGFVLRWLAPTASWLREKLGQAAEREPVSTTAHPYLVSAALSLNVKPERAAAWRATLERAFETGPQNVRYEVCHTLQRIYGVEDLPRLTRFLDHAEGDTRIGSAWTILHVLAKAGVRPAGSQSG